MTVIVDRGSFGQRFATPSLTASAEEAPPVAWPAKALIIGVILLTATIFFFTVDPIASALPLVLVGVAYLFFALPVRIPFLILIFTAAVADSELLRTPSGATWTPPLHPIYVLLFENLNKFLPIQALSFRFVELLYVVFGLLIAARLAFRIKLDRVKQWPTTVVLTGVVAAALGAAVALLVWGVVLRGGDAKQAYYQARQLLWGPILTLGVMYCIRDVRDFNRIINLMIVAACVKIFFVAQFMYTFVRGTGFEPPFVTTHTDSILFSVCMVALLSRFVHRATWRNLGVLVVIGAWLLYGITINNRRVAFVNIAVGVIVVLVMLRGPIKRRMNRALMWIAPVFLIYVVVGQGRNGGFFAPARMAMSVIQQKDASSATRDIENYNLLYTLKQHVLLGSGFGHMYIEVVKAYDISQAFEQYRYLAHNSVLWLWSLGGVLGFTLMWMPVSIGVFLGRRAYLFARSSTERSSAAVAVSMIAIWMNQAWGDLGLHQLNAVFTLAIALTICAKLSVATGAMPIRMRFFSRPDSVQAVSTTVTWPPAAQ